MIYYVTPDVTAVSITLHGTTDAITLAATDVEGSIRVNNAGGIDIPLTTSAHIGTALADTDVDTITIADTFISGIPAATDLSINVSGRTAPDIVLSQVLNISHLQQQVQQLNSSWLQWWWI